MSLMKLLLELRNLGVNVKAEGERLVGDAPTGVLTPELQKALAAHKGELLSLLRIGDFEVAWRVVAMRSQVPQAGALPFLVARDTPLHPGCCLSCGDPLAAGQLYRCGPCARAAAVVVWRISGDPGDGKGAAE